MNSIIETWNSWAEHLPGFVWPMLWQSSLLIAAVFALDLALRRRVRASVRYALWLIVLVKLLLPPSFASPASLAYWVIPAPQLPPAPKPAPTYIVTYGNPTIAELPFPVHSVRPVAEPEAFRPTPTLRAWLLISWTVAGLWLAVILCRRTQRVRQRLTRAEAPADDLSGLLEKCRRQLRLRCPVRLRISEDNTSPAVCGLFRPVILLPRQLTASLNQSQMRAVLLHELIHLKRGDVWVNCVQTLLQIFYWWHPLLWLANARIRRVREETVDDAVMLALADDAETYAPTLLEVAKLAFNRPLTSLGLVGILESRSALRQRIERLMDFRPPRKAGLTMASALCVLAFAALAVPMGEPPPMTSSPSGSDSGSLLSDSSDSEKATASNGTNTLRIDGARSIGISSNAARPRSWYDRQPGPTIIYTNKVGADGTIETPEPAGQTDTPAEQPPPVVIVKTNTDRGRQTILDKLDRIRLPWVAYEGVAFTNVVRDLIVQARAHDPAGRGINFIVNPSVQLPTAPRIDAATGKPLPPLEPPDLKSAIITINPPLTNARLMDVLDAVVKTADKPIQYSIEDYAVVFSSKAVRSSSAIPQAQREAAAAAIQDARVLLEAGRLDEAEAKLKKAMNVDPGNRAASFYLSLLEKTRHLQAESRKGILADPLQMLPNGEPLSAPPFTEHATGRFPQLKDRVPVLGDVPWLGRLSDSESNSPPDAGGTNNPAHADTLYTRTFKVDPNTFLANLRQTGGVTATNDTELISLTLRKLLSEAGVDLQPPQSLYFNPRGMRTRAFIAPFFSPESLYSNPRGMLMARATLRDLDRIEEVVQKLNYAPPHIHIKAKFIEMPEQMALSLPRELGITNRNGAESWSGVVTASQMREMTKQFAAQKSVVILTAPEVTTVSGRQAQIQVVDLRTVMSSTNGVLQTNTVPYGPVLDVFPVFGADGYTIQITAIPSVMEFLGYDDPGQFVPKVPVAPSATGSSPTQVSVLPLPRFRVRQATKSAVLWDGQTLVIGGLSATNVMRFKDQVPVLGDLPLVGRAFRSESTGTQTNTLLVFVTARLVDPAGNPIHRDDQMPFEPDSIPPQPPDQK